VSWMFLAPGFLLGAVAIALPVILHFMRSPPTTVNTFPTLAFLVKSLKKKSRQNNIRRWLVLLARCAILGLLALAFARPFFARHFSSSATATMIVLDTSYSMGAGGQFEKAKAGAEQAVRRLAPGDMTGLILANAHPQLTVPLGADRDAVLRALEAATLSFSANDYETALRLADGQLAASACGTKTLRLFGDGQALAWQGIDFSKPLTPGVQLVVAPAAARQLEDVGIEEVKIAAPLITAGQKMSAQVRIHNRGTAPVDRTLHLTLDGREAATLSLRLNPGEIAERSIDFTAGPLQPTRGEVTIDTDAFPVNDHRYFALNPQTPLYIGLWPPGPAGEVDLLAVALAPAPELATLAPLPIGGPADLAKSDLLVIRPGGVPDPTTETSIVAAITGGKTAIVFADGSHASELWLHDLGVPSVPRPASDDPLHLGAIDFTRPEVALFSRPDHGDLFDIRFTNPPHLQLPSASRVVASFEDGTPAIAELTAGKGSVLLVATGLDRVSTTWPFQSTFLPFLQESIRHLVGREPPPSHVLVGETLPGEHPGVNSETPGVVSVTLGGQPRLVAVNIDPAESDLTPWTNDLKTALLSPPKLKSSSARTLAMLHGEDAERHQHYWWYAILIATGFLLVEIFLANRTTL
jgi:hypothetical protein